MSVTCQYETSLVYESDKTSFEQSMSVVESGVIKNKFVDSETLNSSVKGKITNLVVLDDYNNRYVNDETAYEFAIDYSVVDALIYKLYK